MRSSIHSVSAACAAFLAACVVEVAYATPCPFEGPELLEMMQRGGRTVLSAEPAAPAPAPFSLDGAEPVPFAWGNEEITTPEMDSFKYESEIDQVLNSPLGDWVPIPEDIVMHNDSFTLAVRPIEVEDRHPIQLVGLFEAEFKTRGARAFFDYMVTPDGQDTISDAFTLIGNEETRAAAQTVEGPDDAVVFVTAQPTILPNGLIPLALAATHWQTCGPNELTYMAYPAEVPIEDRLPAVQELEGNPNKIEYSIVFAQRVTQIDEETIKFTSIQWTTLSPSFPEADSYELFMRYYSGVYERLVEHFETVTYPAPTGDECSGQGQGYYGE